MVVRVVWCERGVVCGGVGRTLSMSGSGSGATPIEAARSRCTTTSAYLIEAAGREGQVGHQGSEGEGREAVLWWCRRTSPVNVTTLVCLQTVAHHH